jgi:hypothetical protein
MDYDWEKANAERDRIAVEGSRRAINFYREQGRQREARENQALKARWAAKEAEQRLDTARWALARAQETLAQDDAAREHLAMLRVQLEQAERDAVAARAAAAGAPSYP